MALASAFNSPVGCDCCRGGTCALSLFAAFEFSSGLTLGGNCLLQIYNTSKLTLALVGPQLKHEICALACQGDLTFAAVGSRIVVCKRVERSGGGFKYIDLYQDAEAALLLVKPALQVNGTSS